MRARYPVHFGPARSGVVLFGMAMLCAVLAEPSTVSAATGAGDRANEEGAPRSLLGSYLAGRLARGQHDTEAAAAYYREALTRDPGNDVLIEQSFLMELMQGDWPRSEQLARELSELQPPRRMAHAFFALVGFKAQRYAEADEHFKSAAANMISEIARRLARACLIPARGTP